MVAEAILHAAQTPKRDVYAGSASKMISAGSRAMPRLFDRYMRATMFRQQKSDIAVQPGRRDALHAPNPAHELRQRQGMPGHIHERSLYTKASLRSTPLVTALLGGGALFAAWSLSRRFAR